MFKLSCYLRFVNVWVVISACFFYINQVFACGPNLVRIASEPYSIASSISIENMTSIASPRGEAALSPISRRTSQLFYRQSFSESIESFIQSNQEVIIQRVCATEFMAFQTIVISGSSTPTVTIETFETLLSKLDNTPDGDLAGSCLKKISNYWRQPEELIALLKLSPRVSNFLNDSSSELDRIFAITSYIKIIRREISQSYFKVRFMLKLARHINSIHPLGISDELARDKLSTALVGIGFNRTFSTHSLIASPGTDIDFKLIYDPEHVQARAAHYGFSDFKLAPVLGTVLANSKEEFSHIFGVELEVNAFSIRGIDEIEGYFPSRNEREMNFLASIAKDNFLIFGNPRIYQKFATIINKNLSDSTIYERMFNQFVSVVSDKGSIGKIARLTTMDEWERGMAPLIGMNFLDDGFIRASRAIQSMPWIFSTKYSLIRLFDFLPGDPKTQVLFEIGIYLQYLVVNNLVRSGAGNDAIKQKYEYVTDTSFREILRTSPWALKEIFNLAVRHHMIQQSTYDLLKTLWTPEGHEALTREESSRIGFLFFSDLFNSAFQLSTGWARELGRSI